MNTTNTILIIILVLLVGFGVWYFTSNQSAPAPTEDNNAIEVNLGGGDAPEGEPTPN
ncbi:MAG: hypothetical protein KBD05_00310 [Candidatus Pacebacteria bacterium]|nr:hypothetical protein [Candidatus Paceibacterota bacterium]